MITYIQLFEVLWKKNAGTKEHKKGVPGAQALGVRLVTCCSS
jgi:hypothetical protein